MRCCTCFCFALALIVSEARVAEGASAKSWTGGGGNGNWGTGGNWAPFGAPNNDDHLIFPTGAAFLNNTNNLLDRTFGSITFNGGGYNLRGNGIALTGDIIATHTSGANTIEFPITLDRGHRFETDGAGTLNVSGNINLQNASLGVRVNGGTITLSGIISGQASVITALYKSGAGTLVLSGPSRNTYSGYFEMTAGTLQLNKTVGPAVTQNLNVSNLNTTVTLMSSNQLGDTTPVTLHRATLNLNNHSDEIGELIMAGATVNTGTGILTLRHTVDGVRAEPSTVSSVINGNLDLFLHTPQFRVSPGAAADGLVVNANISGGFATDKFGNPVYSGIHKLGDGRMVLNGNNTFAGTVRVLEGTLVAGSATAFGSTNGGVQVYWNSSLGLNGVHIGNEALIINATNVGLWASVVSSWSGPVTLNSNTTFQSSGTMTFSNVISGPGELRLEGATFEITGEDANTHTGLTVSLASLLRLNKPPGLDAINGHLEIGDSLSPDDSHVVRLLQNAQIDENVRINCSGLLDVNFRTETLSLLTLVGGNVTNIGQHLSVLGRLEVETGGSGCSHSRITAGRTFTLFNIAPQSWELRFPSESLTQFVPELVMDCSIVNSGDILVSGNSGHLYLMVSNQFTGAFSVSSTVDPGVTVHLLDDYALGATTAGTIVSGRAGLAIETGLTIREPLTICGVGPGSNGVIQANGTSTWQTNVILSCDSLINCLPSSAFTVDGLVGGPGGFTKIGSGALTLGGSQNNVYTGNTLVHEGVLNLAKTAAEAIRGGTLVVGDDFGGVNVDIVRHLGGNQINNAVTLTIFGSGLLDLNGFNDEIGSFTLNGGDVATGTGTLTLGGDVTSLAASNSASIFSGRVQLLATRSFNVTNGTSSPDVRINASVIGPGGLIKNGRGDLSLNASNTYAGLTTINAGIIDVDDNFALGATNTGTVVNSGASLVVRGGSQVGVEPLTITGNGFSATVGALDGRNGSNSWAGPILVETNAVIRVNAASDFLNLSGSTGGGDISIHKTGPGTLILSGRAFSIVENMFVDEGTFLLAKDLSDTAVFFDLHVGDGLGGSNADVVRAIVRAQISNGTRVHIARSGLLDLNDISDGIGGLDGLGRVDLGSARLTTGLNDLDTTYRGVIEGTGGFTKTGSGIMILTGNNTYSGETIVNEGTLAINGFQPQSKVTVTSSGTLSGSGTVGDISVAGGNLSPNPNPSQGLLPAMLTSSNVAFTGVSDFFVELNGPTAGADYDQLNVRGTNSLGSTFLHVAVGPDFAPAEGERLTIIENDGSEPMVGTFLSLPNGSILNVGVLQFRIVYDNDVALLVTNTALQFFAIALSGGNRNGVIDPNECNLLNVTLTNVSGALVTGVSATLIPKTAGVSVTQPFSPYPDLPAAGRRTNSIAFQVSTLPGFLCGTNVEFALVVRTATNGSFTIPIRLPSGSIGAPLRFDNNTVLGIPDSGLSGLSIAVSGVTTPIKRVSVSLHITHSAVADLDIMLYTGGAEHTTINLSSDNGGAFSNYGTDCTDSGRTVFTDTAIASIISGSAPFVGSFRPEQPLSAFNEKFGSAANELWWLEVRDDSVNGVFGTIRCWSLFVSGTDCTDGGGACESCPERTILGSISDRSSVQNGHVVSDGNPSSCANMKACPGTAAVGARSFDAYTFVNGESAACINVALSAPCELFSMAYRDSHDPADLCRNYLADIGFSVFGNFTNAYSFTVGPRETFVVVVNNMASTAFCDYRLSVTGGSCRPALGIAPLIASQVLLDWSTAAVGYELERADSLAGPIWVPVPQVPSIENSRFNLTQPIPGTNRFYRLRKP